MDYTILEVYRHNLYHTCFRRAADALFDVCDALLTDVVARSFVELSQAPSFRRAWPSLYEALEDGQIDRTALIRLFIDMLPLRLVGTRLVLGLDTEPFAASLGEVDGVEFAALDLVQHGLAGDAEAGGGLAEGQPAVGGLGPDHIAELLVDADLPGCSGGELLAGDEAVA